MSEVVLSVCDHEREREREMMVAFRIAAPPHFDFAQPDG